MNWQTIVTAARAAFEKGANEWILRARVKGGVIRGPNAELTPGSLSSEVNFERALLQEMLAAGAPKEVGVAIARELWSAWKEWADGFHMSLPGAFPKFAAYPGPQAPLTRAAQPGYQLVRGTLNGEHRLQAGTLQTRLATALRSVAGRESLAMESELKSLTSWIDASFREWKASAQITGLSGKGSVQTFAPPYVPVGPVVVARDALSGDSVLAGPRFGKLGA